MNNAVTITKASGIRAPYSEEKLRHSLTRSGADRDTVDRVLKEVQNQLYEGMPTHKIHKLAFKLLRRASRHYAAKYRLKQAIMELGPSGFPFEKYVAEILKHKGYLTQTDQIVKGHCVNHELDVTAKKEDRLFMVECKYHNRTGIICDVKVPLYIKARFEDIEKQWQETPQEGIKFHQGWLITNTRFSDDAIKYGTCSGLNLVGWDYPVKGNIKEWIDVSGLYPITCLTSLNKTEKQRLLDKRVVLCKELLEDNQLLLGVNISLNRLEAVIKEAHILCNKDIMNSDRSHQ